MMATRPAALVAVGTPDTTVFLVNLLRAVPGVVLPIWKPYKKEQVSMEELLNFSLHASHTQKDEVAAAKVSAAQKYFLRGSVTVQ